jgi:hypothetical protein
LAVERRTNLENRKSKIENRKSKIENRKSKIENRKSKIENRKELTQRALRKSAEVAEKKKPHPENSRVRHPANIEVPRPSLSDGLRMTTLIFVASADVRPGKTDRAT